MFYLQVVFAHTPINSASFMICHMHTVCTASKGSISVVGVITSIARALGPDAELTTHEPLPPRALDLRACRSMRFIRSMSDINFFMMVHNIAIHGIVLPCSDCTNVRNEANWIYNFRAELEAEPEPVDIHENVAADGATDDEYDQIERVSLVHQPPPHHSPHIPASPTHTTHFSDNFIGTSSRATQVILDDILNVMRAMNAIDVERDNLIYSIHKKQTGVMQHINQIQIEQSTIMEQMGQMQVFQTNMTNNV